MSFNDKNNNQKKNNISKKVSKKGIIITCVIVLGIISASFLIWFLPSGNIQNQTQDAISITFSSPNDTLVYVTTHHVLLQNEIKNQLNLFKNHSINETQLSNSLDTTSNQNEQLMKILLDNKPSNEQGDMLNKYINMMNSLKNFSFYLKDLKNLSSVATSNSSINISTEIDVIDKKWKMK